MSRYYIAFTRKQYFGLVLMVLVTLALCIQLGKNIGWQNGWNEYDQLNQLPSCEEDEFLYPYDYKGPGENLPTDYQCVHADTIVGEAVNG